MSHGPFCALCGCCKSCFDAGLVVDRFCWDDPNRPLRQGKHLWNAPQVSAAETEEPT